MGGIAPSPTLFAQKYSHNFVQKVLIYAYKMV